MVTDKMTSFQIGSDVSCPEGTLGTLAKVVVDPVKRAVTHLAVEPKGRVGLAKLVPVEMVTSTDPSIQVNCAAAEFEKLPDAEEMKFLLGEMGSGYQAGQMMMWPYYGLGMGGFGVAAPGPVAYDKVPLGEIEVAKGDPVIATDGPIGRVRGLVIDPTDHHMTHILLDEGHLWGHKTVVIPIKQVVGVNEGIRLRISKKDVEELPDVSLDDISL
jgi:sporulation protein YlmC with PRC-barrel domain